jgi:hypothetical protein
MWQRVQRRGAAAFLFAAGAVFGGFGATAAQAAPAEDGLTLDFSHRSRFEALHNQFRPGLGRVDHGYVLRTRAALNYARGGLRLGAEVLDARAYGLAPHSSADGNLVDVFEPLVAFVGWEGAIGDERRLSLRAGRLTPSFGAGRLVGRNGYRNMPNAFTGALAEVTAEDRRLQLFALSPQRRLPGNFEDVRENHWDLDEESTDARLLGAYAAMPSGGGDQLEAYALVLRERDGGAPTRNRRLQTVGGRWLRAPAPGAWDGELEAAMQWGEVRATAAAHDGAVLKARSAFFHGAAGVSAEGPWAPRFALLLDYASGDDNPTDQRWGRFDALFGPVRGDLGPTSLFTHVLRGNFLSPAARLELKPTAALSAQMTLRGVWLDAERDAQVGSGVRDVAGESGDDVGTQLDARLVWRPAPRWTLDGGIALFNHGGFMRRAPNASGQGDPAYGYFSVTYRAPTFRF